MFSVLLGGRRSARWKWFRGREVDLQVFANLCWDWGTIFWCKSKSMYLRNTIWFHWIRAAQCFACAQGESVIFQAAQVNDLQATVGHSRWSFRYRRSSDVCPSQCLAWSWSSINKFHSNLPFVHWSWTRAMTEGPFAVSWCQWIQNLEMKLF